MKVQFVVSIFVINPDKTLTIRIILKKNKIIIKIILKQGVKMWYWFVFKWMNSMRGIAINVSANYFKENN